MEIRRARRYSAAWHNWPVVNRVVDVGWPWVLPSRPDDVPDGEHQRQDVQAQPRRRRGPDVGHRHLHHLPQAVRSRRRKPPRRIRQQFVRRQGRHARVHPLSPTRPRLRRRRPGRSFRHHRRHRGEQVRNR